MLQPFERRFWQFCFYCCKYLQDLQTQWKSSLQMRKYVYTRYYKLCLYSINTLLFLLFQTIGEYDRSVSHFEQSINLGITDSCWAQRRIHAVRCHQKLEQALEAQHLWVSILLSIINSIFNHISRGFLPNIFYHFNLRNALAISQKRYHLSKENFTG